MPTPADGLVEVYVPAGLKAKQPVLAYALGQADSQGHCKLVKDGSVSVCAEQGDSLVYQLNLGRHSHGVYALALSGSTSGVYFPKMPRIWSDTSA